MSTINPTKTVITISQYLDYLRQGSLDLKPRFQRREVWKTNAKSYFIDTLVRGYPVPIILLRQVHDLKSLSSRLEVVDGQQRLRTVMSFLDSAALTDFDPQRDDFTVSSMHNDDPQIARKKFRQLPASVQSDLLAYELSTHIFSAETGDAEVYRIFARLNSTGLSLNHQEIRNAEFHGAFKSLVYDLGFSHLDFWRDCRIFSDDSIARMAEAEAVSECILLIIHGIVAKRQKDISGYYERYDDAVPKQGVVTARFEEVIQAIERTLGEALPKSRFRRPALFYSLFSVVYDHMYGLKSPLVRTRASRLPADFCKHVERVSDDIANGKLPPSVEDAMVKATADKKRRMERHRFLLKKLGLSSAR